MRLVDKAKYQKLKKRTRSTQLKYIVVFSARIPESWFSGLAGISVKGLLYEVQDFRSLP